MNICVAGWYFEKFDEFYASLYRIKENHNIHIVANRHSDFLEIADLPYTVRENTGLEWGAYNHYLMNIWEGGPTLFTHDDVILGPVLEDYEFKPPEFLFDRIADASIDQGYVFSSRREDVVNYGQHGRMIFMSDSFLNKAKQSGGFWFDDTNTGNTETGDYNAGINRFREQTVKIGGDINRKIYIPAFNLLKRGDITVNT